MPRVLIVEDDVQFRLIFRRILIDHFASLQVEVAPSNRQALEKIKLFSPQLMLVDTHVSNGSTLPLVKQAKSIYPEMIIVALSLYNIPEYQNAALQSGADYFLAKSSLTGSTLIALVESILAFMH